jgi:hypothetical protein
MYKLEAEIQAAKTVLIVLAESDEKAFEAAEEHLVRHYIAKPEVKELSILEKKQAAAGAGYVIETKP